MIKVYAIDPWKEIPVVSESDVIKITDSFVTLDGKSGAFGYRSRLPKSMAWTSPADAINAEMVRVLNLLDGHRKSTEKLESRLVQLKALLEKYK